MNNINEQDGDKARLLVSLLYTKNVFQDFRRPVLAAYPEIAKSYLDIVEVPMDLGTLYLKIHSGQVGVDDVRKNLQLITNNALLFNEGCTWLESLIKHLANTSEGLFEEIFRTPYHPENYASSDIATFEQDLHARRLARFAFAADVNMNTSELELLRRLLDPATKAETVPERARSLTKASCIEIQTSIEEAYPDEEYGVKVVKDVSLRDIARLLLECAVEEFSFSSTVSSSSSCSILESVYPQRAVKDMYEYFAVLVGEAFGILAVLIEERVLRGSSVSTNWATPYPDLVWVQLPKDSKGRQLYWPSMVIVSNSPAFPMSREVMKHNVERLPDEIVRGLIKLRPRFIPNKSETSSDQTDTNTTTEVSTSSSGDSQDNLIWLTAKKVVAEEKVRADRAPPATTTACPEGYVIIEYFGDHDVGWMKADATTRMEAPGVYPAPPNKIAGPKVLEEAQAARTLLEKRSKFKAEATDEDSDLHTMPDISDLEHSILISDTLKNLMNKSTEKTPKKSATPKKRATPVAKEQVEEEPNNDAANSSKKRAVKPKVADIVDINGVVLTNIPTPSKLRPQEYKVNYGRGIVDDKFFPSKCPLPVQVQTDVIPPGFHSKHGLNYRRNAVIRSRCYAYYLQQIRPQDFVEKEPLPTAPAIITSTMSPAAAGEQDRTEFKLDIELDKPKRKYFKKTDFSIGTTNSEGKFSILEHGTTRYAFGKGLIYATKINFEDPLFFRESKDQSERLKMLEMELNRIKRGVEDLKLLTAAPETVRPTPESSGKAQEAHSSREHIESPPPAAAPKLAKKSPPQLCALQSLTSSSLVAKASEVLPGKVGMIAKFQSEKRDRGSLGSSAQAPAKKPKTSLDPTSVNDMMPVL